MLVSKVSQSRSLMQLIAVLSLNTGHTSFIQKPTKRIHFFDSPLNMNSIGLPK